MYLVSIIRQPSFNKTKSLIELAKCLDRKRLHQDLWELSGFRVEILGHKRPKFGKDEKNESYTDFRFYFGNKHDVGALKTGGPWIEFVLNAKEEYVEVKRDPAGLMTSFFAKTPGGYLISDSVPVLLESENISRTVDLEALNEYWYLDFCIPPKTIWTDIRAVPNAHTITLPLKSDSEPVCKQYWVPGRNASKYGQLTSEEAPTVLRNVILEETKRAIDSIDNEFVNLLSGGIDSSVILAACHILGRKPEHVITFKSIGDSDESVLAVNTAKHFGIPIQIVEADKSNLLNDVTKIIKIWGQPYAHGSVHALQKLIAHVPDGRALLTGDGGGEAFISSKGGLSKFRNLALMTLNGINRMPQKFLHSLYKNLAADSKTLRILGYGLELKAAQSDAERILRSGPITQWETESVFKENILNALSKKKIELQLQILAKKSELPEESVFSRSLLYWWSSEGVYAKTWRLLDYAGLIGLGPLTCPRYFDKVKQIPSDKRGKEKHQLRDSFADVLPSAVLEASKRGLRPLNRELIAKQADEGIDWITDGRSETWDQLFDGETIVEFWKAHQDGKVFRSNLIFKAMIFKAWCEEWKPIIN